MIDDAAIGVLEQWRNGGKRINRDRSIPLLYYPITPLLHYSITLAL